MRKLFVLLFCCICLCGCSKKQVTMCGNNENSIEIQHYKNKVNKIKIKDTVEFDTLSEALESEEKLSKQILDQNMNKNLNFYRKDKTIKLEGTFTLKEYSVFMNISINSYSDLIKYLESDLFYGKCQEMK